MQLKLLDRELVPYRRRYLSCCFC